MIKNLFLETVNMSITASVVIVAVIVLRWLFRKQPKIYSYLLWSMVLFRLLCPYSFSLDTSAFNLLPARQTEKGQIEYTVPQAVVENIIPQTEGQFTADVVVSPEISRKEEIYIPQTEEKTENIIVMSPQPKTDYINILAILWLAGMIYMLTDNLISLYEIKSQLKNSEKLYGNVYRSDAISTAFIIGVLKPSIYLPKNLSEQRQRYIIFHEETHLKRKDYLFKFIGFIALARHWFNPLVWLAYNLAEKDMEMSCDEAVIKQLGSMEKQGYSRTLLSLSMPFREYRTMHLAFGEGETKQRIVNILSFKKPKTVYAVAVVCAIVITAVLFISNPSQLNAKKVLEFNDSDISDVILVEEKQYLAIPDSMVNSLTHNLKKTKVAVSRETDVKQGNQLIMLKKDGKDMLIKFSYGCDKMWVESQDDETDGVVYDIKNPEIIKGFIYGNVTDRVRPEQTQQLMFPVDDCTFCQQVEAFMVNVEIPQGWYFYTDRHNTPDSRTAMLPNYYGRIHLINDMNETVGAICFGVPNGIDYDIDSAQSLMDYFYQADGIIFDISQYKVWPKYGEIALASFSRGVNNYQNYGALVVKKGFEPFVFMSFIPEKVTWEQAQSIASSIDVQTKDGGIIRASTLSYWINPSETEDVMAQTAAEVHLKDYQHSGYTINNVEYVVAGEQTAFEYPRQLFSGYDYVVKVDFLDSSEKQHINYLYIDKIEDTDFSILGYVEKGDKILPEDYEITTYRLKNVLPQTKVEKDNTLTLGIVETVSEGQSGLEMEKVTQVYHNGMVISEQVIETQVLQESQPELIKQGTLWNGVPISSGTGRLKWPMAGIGRISRGFTGQYPQHNGIDISASIGAEICAAADGTVVKALYTDKGYGIYCIIEHGDYQTVYAHCSELLIQRGQKVQQGQVIAKVGCSGNSTGPHLHFEVKKGDTRYNPYDWF